MLPGRPSCCHPLLALVGLLIVLVQPAHADDPPPRTRVLLERLGISRGLCVVLGDPRGERTLALARHSDLTLHVQTPSRLDAQAIRKAADTAGHLGNRVFATHGSLARLHLADDLADAVVVEKAGEVPREELLRILRPGGKALVGTTDLVKPFPKDTDDWPHPYHAADNNPVSSDGRMKRPYLTHFLAEPWYCPLPGMTVISGGRIFKIFGDRSSAKPQEALINTLVAMNAFNGTMLWQRKLNPGFMIHRNTFLATPETLYLADNVSCKRIDPATGRIRDEIVPPAEFVDGPTWKWMALEGNILYALVGEKEGSDEPLRGPRIRGAGWPWWKIKNYPFGFGRTFLAIDLSTKKVLWHHREKEKIDSRGTCAKNGRIYYYANGKFLAALETRTGKVAWKNTDRTLLDAIGEEGEAQHWMLGFASTAYLKCADEALYFAGPQRPRIVAASTRDGKLLWQRAGGNSQLILRPEAVYALGEGSVNAKISSQKLEPLTGKLLATFPSRDRCTRATACLDSIFTRGGKGGSTALFDLTGMEPKMGTIAPMRPACQDGVVVAHGHLYWGPWMCRCDLTQLGVISLGPGGSFDYLAKASDRERLETFDEAKVADLPGHEDDWPTYRKDVARRTTTAVATPTEVARAWEFVPAGRSLATAPVTAGGLVVVAGSDGAVRALDATTGKPRWTVFTGGAMKYPPAIWNGRVFAGSGDGHVYCLEAASGRQLWRFRGAPVERFIPVYGSLCSTWPIGSGVLVDDGVVYAAAGITSLDGTHVYALDARTGKIRWQNHSSAYGDGNVPGWGPSVQGHLLLHDGSVFMAGGNQPTVASYAVKDGTFAARGSGRGKDLYLRNNEVRATGFPLHWRPQDDHFLSPMEMETARGVLAIDTGKLVLRSPKGGPRAKPLWACTPFQEIAAVAVTRNVLLVTGLDRPDRKDPDRNEAGLCAVDLQTGKVSWRQPLPAAPVLWGLAVDRTGRVLVTLTDGRVLAFARK